MNGRFSLALLIVLLTAFAACGADRPAARPLPVTFFEPLALTRARQQAQQEADQRRAAVRALPFAWLRTGELIARAVQEKADNAKAAAEKAAAERDQKAAAAKAAAEKQAAAKAEREAEANAQVQQYIQLLQPTLWTELDFIRQACDLPPAQRPKIKAAGDASVKQAAQDFGTRRMIGGAARPRAVTSASAAQMIRDALSRALKEVLPAEEFAKYNEEAGQRITHRKQTAILGVVSRLDSLLCLSRDQREKMVESIGSQWQEEWEQWLMLHQHGGQYYPQVPDKHVVPLLNEQQRQVWSSVQKFNVSAWGGDDGRARDTAWWEGK